MTFAFLDKCIYIYLWKTFFFLNSVVNWRYHISSFDDLSNLDNWNCKTSRTPWDVNWSKVRRGTPVIAAFPNRTDRNDRTERDAAVLSPDNEPGIVETAAGNRPRTSRSRPARASRIPGERDWSAIPPGTRTASARPSRICRTKWKYTLD